MKKTFSVVWLIAAILVFPITSCDDGDGPENLPQSKGEETVQDIVKALESNEEISLFVEELKKIELPDINEDKLTVFAVKNDRTESASRAANLDSTSIKRHIAVGSYPKSQLTDGLVLKSVNGENLYISRKGNDVEVNGVEIEGEEMAVGNSFVYVVPKVFEKLEAPIIREDSLVVVRDLWNYEMKSFADQSWITEASLTTGYSGFSFNEITTLSDMYWDKALKAIKSGELYLKEIADMENAAGLSDTIKLDLAVIKTQMFTYYGTYISDNRACQLEEYKLWLHDLSAELPSALSNASLLLWAKVSLCTGEYEMAKVLCQQLIATNRFKLSTDAYTYEPENVWRGYEGIIPSGDGGRTPMYPLLTREIYLIRGLAEYASGVKAGLLDVTNTINAAYGKPNISGIENINISEFLFYIRNTGDMYPYYRVLKNMNYDLAYSHPNVPGFNENIHLLLPIPVSAIDEYGIQQNQGY